MTAALLLLGEDIDTKLEGVELAHTIAPSISNMRRNGHPPFLRRVEEFDFSNCDDKTVSRVTKILEKYEGKAWNDESKDVSVVYQWVAYVMGVVQKWEKKEDRNSSPEEVKQVDSDREETKED